MPPPMTPDEFFARVEQAAPEKRWEVAEALLPELGEDDRELVESVLADFVYALGTPVEPKAKS